MKLNFVFDFFEQDFYPYKREKPPALSNKEG